MEKFMFKKFVPVLLALFAASAFSGVDSAVSGQAHFYLLYARIAEIMFVLEMVKLPIVLPILP
jgi:hypothetical protein